MNTLNSFSSKTYQINKQSIPSLNHHRPFLAKPFSSLSFRTPPPKSSSYSLFTIKASSSSNSSYPLPNPKTPKPQFDFLKPTLIATITAAALFFTRFYVFPKPALSVSASPPPAMESEVNDSVSEEERERAIEEHLVSNPNDIDALRNLMEIRIKNKKMPEAISIIDRLIEIEPNETEWPLMKSHLYVYSGESELAKVGFNEILKNDPLRVEAYHGLVMVASEDDAIEELKEIEEKVEEGIKICKKEGKNSDLRDFKLLLAQIRVIKGKYDDALKVYQELVKEEPRDFRPYLCQGIIYTLLKKQDEAEKSFEKYRRLVPQGHPYARYFDDNMMATKLFAQKAENERVGSKN